MLTNEYMGFLVSIVDKSKDEKLESNYVPIVREFIKIFPEQLLGLPPEWEIPFEIELLPGTEPISKAL